MKTRHSCRARFRVRLEYRGKTRSKSTLRLRFGKTKKYRMPPLKETSPYIHNTGGGKWGGGGVMGWGGGERGGGGGGGGRGGGGGGGRGVVGGFVGGGGGGGWLEW